MKNKDILKLYEGLCELEQLQGLHLKARTSYQLAKDKLIIEPFYNLIKKCELDIWKQFGTILDDGNVSVEKDKVGELNKAYDDLMEIETDVNIDKIELNEFDGQGISMELFGKLIRVIKEA